MKFTATCNQPLMFPQHNLTSSPAMHTRTNIPARFPHFGNEPGTKANRLLSPKPDQKTHSRSTKTQCEHQKCRQHTRRHQPPKPPHSSGLETVRLEFAPYKIVVIELVIRQIKSVIPRLFRPTGFFI